jgi:hypothetical protein
MFWMASCVAICWPPNGQGTKCTLDTSNPCSQLHVKILDAEGWIKLRPKCNVEVKEECAMWNKQIDGLTTNHNLAPLAWTKTNAGFRCWGNGVILQDRPKRCVMVDVHQRFINAYKLGVLVIAKVSKEKCISLATWRRPSCIEHKHD